MWMIREGHIKIYKNNMENGIANMKTLRQNKMVWFGKRKETEA